MTQRAHMTVLEFVEAATRVSGLPRRVAIAMTAALVASVLRSRSGDLASGQDIGEAQVFVETLGAPMVVEIAATVLGDAATPGKVLYPWGLFRARCQQATAPKVAR